MRLSKLKHKELLSILEKYDDKNMTTKVYDPVGENPLEKHFEETILSDAFSLRSVLGIDIYQYSQYDYNKQTLIPFLFNLIYDEAAKNCKAKSGFLFQKQRSQSFKKEFINTGDGGFQLLETPLHSIALAINFQMIVRYYNAFRFYPNLRKMIGPISLRYAITTDRVFEYEGNFYGPAIINNARIISKDALNRFLIDERTYDWFMSTIMGVENLQFISNVDIAKLPQFALYDPKVRSKHEMIFPEDRDFSYQKITTCDVQKIGNIKAKNTALSIYNLHLQFLGDLTGDVDEDKPIAFSIGNLNLGGID